MATERSRKVYETQKRQRGQFVPVYKQLANILRAKVEEMRPGERVLSERELARRYKVCRTTVERVTAMLVEEGVVWQGQGRGTFVTEKRT